MFRFLAHMEPSKASVKRTDLLSGQVLTFQASWEDRIHTKFQLPHESCFRISKAMKTPNAKPPQSPTPVLETSSLWLGALNPINPINPKTL